MCLRFVFLLITRTASWLRLSRREETWRIAEILILRHQLAVLQRRQPRRPKLNWADRALLATLLGAIPKARRQGAAAAGHPGHHAALAPGHRPPPLGRQVHARQGRPAGDPPEHQGPGPPAGPREPRVMWSRGLCGAGDVLLLVVVSVSRVVSRIAGCELHITFRCSQVFEPLDDVLVDVPADFTFRVGNEGWAAFDRFAFHRHVDLDVLTCGGDGGVGWGRSPGGAGHGAAG